MDASFKEFLDHVLYLIYFEHVMVDVPEDKREKRPTKNHVYLERTMAVNGNSISSGKDCLKSLFKDTGGFAKLSITYELFA